MSRQHNDDVPTLIPPVPTKLEGSRGRRQLPVFALVVLAGLGALLGLGRQPLWFDEIATARAVSLPWNGLRSLLLHTDANLGIYYAGLHVWEALGNSPTLLRLPSALAAVGTVLLTVRAGRRLLGRGPALLAAVLLAVHPFATAYARDARPYALVAMSTTAALLLGLRAISQPTTGRLAAYAATAGLAIFLHLYAVLIIIGYGLALLPARGAGRSRWVATHGVVLLMGLPVLAVSLRQHAQLFWVPALSPGRVLSGLALLSGGAIGLGGLVAAALLVRRLGRLRPQAGRVLAYGLLLPVGALLTASLVAPTFVPRYLVGTVPLQCLLLAAGIGALRSRRLRGVVTVALLVWFAGSTVLQAAAPYRYEDYRAAGRALLAGSHAGQAVVYAQQGARLGVTHYLLQTVRTPHDVLALPGPATGFSVPLLTGAAAARALAPYRQVWLVDHLDEPQVALAAMSRYRCPPPRRFGLVAIALCTARS